MENQCYSSAKRYGVAHLIVFFTLFLWNSAVFAQTLTVKDAETLKPIELSTIISESGALFVVTNVKGQADITEFRGMDKIEIRILGYKPRVLSYQQLREMNFEVTLQHSDLDLEEIIISVSRRRQRSNKVPAKVTSVSMPQVTLFNPQTSADLLGTTGQVFIQKSQQGGGSPMIRGFATNRLLYTVDGIRMNNAIFRGGNIQNVINIDPFSVQKTEILFGPGSVIYGSDAIGGVMNFQTLTPQFSLNDAPYISGSVQGRFSSANTERTGHFDINTGWKKWALVTSFSTWNFGDLRQGSHGPSDYIKSFYVQRQDDTDRVISQRDPLLQIPTAYTQWNLMQKVRYRPSAKWDFQYGFHFSETSPYGRYDRHNRSRNSLPRYAEWRYGPQQWMMNTIQVNHISDKNWLDQMNVRVAHQYFQESRIDRDLNDPIRRNRKEQVDAYSVNADLHSHIRDFSIYYGAEYVYNHVRSDGKLENILSGTVTEGPSRYPQSDWSSLGIYLSGDKPFSERLTMQGGIRYNHFGLNADFRTDFYPLPFEETQIRNGALTGNLGLVFSQSDQTTMNFAMGTAFRSPNVDDAGKIFDSEPGAVVVPNPDLQAEYAWNIEGGIDHRFGDIVRAELTLYYTLLNNAMVRRDFQLNGQDQIFYDGELSDVQAIQNGAQTTVYGFQTSLRVAIHPYLTLTGHLNAQVGREELADGSVSPSRHAAPFFGSTRLRYAQENLQLILSFDYQGERTFNDLAFEERNKDEIYAKDANGNNFAPGWGVLHLKTLYEINELITITAGLENITDVRYRPYSSGISGAGRNFYISVRTRF